ncbi:MAG: hypothetical protein HYT31_05050 [Parcubacteria group bacterium]|nr:hypothetical protein [Parcubacteria group bacterium]
MSVIPKSLKVGDEFTVTFRVASELAYGENRDQSPAFVCSDGSDDPLALHQFAVVSGTPGYINMADCDRALQVLCLMHEALKRQFPGKFPFIAIACKHGNPCGAAIDWRDPVVAVFKAMDGDPSAVMGAEVMVNFPVTGEVAEIIYLIPDHLQDSVGRKFWGPDVVFAPAFDDEAVALLGKREKRRLLVNPALGQPFMPRYEWVLRPARGGPLCQRAPVYVFGDGGIDWAFDRSTLSSDDLATIILAWAVAWRSNSNCVVLARDLKLIGPGVGQQDRRFCCKLGIERAKAAGHTTTGSFFASDAFFPFATRNRDSDPPDGPELLFEAGCRGGVVQADGVRLAEVKAFFAEHKMRVAFIPSDHRGFSNH